MTEERPIKPASNSWFVVGILSTMFVCVCIASMGVVLMYAAMQGSSSVIATEIPSTTEIPLADPDLPVIAEQSLTDAEVPEADLPKFVEMLSGIDVPEVLAESADPIAIGTQQNFWVTDVDVVETISVVATMVYATDHVYFWVDDRVSYEIEDVRRIVDNFEEQTYPTVRSYIGSEWTPGVDGDVHLHILLTQRLGSSVAGLFFSRDEYSPLVHEFSNGHEMFYLSAENLLLSGYYIDSVLAHEFQHMVQWFVDKNEETWLNEGFSQFSEYILGYDIGGFDFLYSRDTDQPLQRWPSEPGTAGAHYGQTFLFLTYLYDRFGPDFVRALAENKGNGLASIDQTLKQVIANDPVTGEELTVENVFLDWAVSLVLQDPDFADGRYGLSSYVNAPIADFTDVYSRCPVEEQVREVHQYGVDLIQFDCDGEFTLKFTAPTQAQVIPEDARSGNYAIWSNFGDDSGMRMTRSFDLREATETIRFEYWTWYTLEKDFDYAYLTVSTDGGETWEILKTPSGTDENPSGNSFGWAYNGMSGNGSAPSWIHESVDLSQYAGQEILLRFEYVTDTAVNSEGLLLDDLSIEAIGYEEDFEEGDGDWQLEGFVRLHNRIPQRFKLAMIERGDEVRVNEIVLDSQNRAEVQLSFEDGLEEIILVVTATSRHSWLPANYHFEILQ
ncbi:MAG: hypothetical protein GTO18_21565 [Anaerolineales bacterium]|nr:hypothetical protein [Anaerolineales bacterium]